ncbi:rhomboid family intramembrane serine protease [Fontivita pretiosa]|uniref:rhomboid family intramembrane serine protease n=1 Tax=Fontivita pretiosa TaxID=2989684 RepID=UPI003D16B051
MILPIRTDSPLRGTPWANWTLIAANIVVFFVQRWLWPDVQSQPLALRGDDPQLLHYFTYQFLHADGLHLAGNVLFLYIFGNNVNDRMGHWGYVAFYLAGGVFAGIGHVLSSTNPVIGASGAVSAVTGAYLVLLPRSHVTIFYFFILIGMAEIPSFVFILMRFIFDFVMGFSDRGGNVAHTAHLAGYVFGAGVSFALLAAHLLPRDQFDLFALYRQWNRRRQYRDMVRKGYDPFGIAPPQARATLDPRMPRIQELRAQISEAIAHHRIEEAARLFLELREIDPQQVLSRQNQLDVANQLFAQDAHAAAADAYEGFLRFYPKYEQVEQIQLMLGLLYARYLNRPDKAREYLNASLQRLSNPGQIELAQAELSRIGAAV